MPRSTKLTFVVLVLAHGTRFLGPQAGVAVIVDSIWVLVFAAYLVAARKTAAPANP